MAITFQQLVDGRIPREVEKWYIRAGYDNGLRAVISVYKEYVLTDGNYGDDPSLYETRPDLDGNCILRVFPAPGAIFYTDEEADQIMEYEAIDQQMLGWAT
jgi:hypothetical protein